MTVNFQFIDFYAPYFEHIKQGWTRRNDENVLFLFYEDLRRDLKGSLKILSEFLGKTLQDNDLTELQDHLDIKNFKVNPAINGKDYSLIRMFSENGSFIRHGQSGELSKYSGEAIKKFEKWIEVNLRDLKTIGFEFPKSNVNYNCNAA